MNSRDDDFAASAPNDASAEDASRAGGPFSGSVSFEEVAARIEATPLGDAPETECAAGAVREAFARLVLNCSLEDAAARAAGRAVTAGGVAGRVVPEEEPDEQRADPAWPRILWFHGGGYVFGAPETHARAAGVLASAAGEPVLLPRYRLAPAHPWPAPLEDGCAAVRAAQAARGPVALVGDSAGGHLALTTALELGREGRPPAALVLFSPNTDRTGLSSTRAANTPRDPMNADEDDRALARLAFGHCPPSDPQVSPLLSDLALLPPTYVEAGGREVLLGDARLLAQRGHAAGGDVQLRVEPDAFHMWQLWAPWLPAANASLQRAGAFLRAQLAAADRSC